jgi:hypothetical protein
MSTGPLVVVAATVSMSARDVESICADLQDLGVSASLSDTLERRGAGTELWHFILQTDWGVVRDTVIASGLAAGIPAGLKTLSHAAKRLAEKFGSIRRKMPGGPGVFVIRDTRKGIELYLPADSVADVTAWLKLLEGRPPVTTLRWDEADHEWVSRGNN